MVRSASLLGSDSKVWLQASRQNPTELFFHHQKKGTHWTHPFRTEFRYTAYGELKQTIYSLITILIFPL